jgi:galactokinase
LQKVTQIKALGELTEDEFEQHKAAIQNPIHTNRAKHAVYENQRTIKAVEALKNKDLTLFGQLMNASHVSLQNDYEVTGVELDTMVKAAWKQEGVIGARMTGAGFGGCAVSIVNEEYVDAFIKNVGSEYKEKIGYDATFYVVDIGNGPTVL